MVRCRLNRVCNTGTQSPVSKRARARTHTRGYAHMDNLRSCCQPFSYPPISSPLRASVFFLFVYLCPSILLPLGQSVSYGTRTFSPHLIFVLPFRYVHAIHTHTHACTHTHMRACRSGEQTGAKVCIFQCPTNRVLSEYRILKKNLGDTYTDTETHTHTHTILKEG